MKLFAGTDGRDTDWMIKLVDVYPDGFAMNVPRACCVLASAMASTRWNCCSRARL